MSKPSWRPARISDVGAIVAIAARLHPDLPERPEVLAEKVQLYPAGCRVLVAGDTIGGYGLAYPWKQHQIPPLDGLLERLPENADCLYVHDVAVLPDRRGGVTREYIAAVAELARASGVTMLALVSVYATRPLWEHLGFRPVTADAALRAMLASYGEGATYMLRSVIAA